MSRKALMIGIDDYEGCKLSACVNDAKALGEALEYNYDDTKNFDVSFLLDAEATRARVRKSIKNLFKGNDDIALLYFSGHGIDDENDGFIVTHDFAPVSYTHLYYLGLIAYKQGLYQLALDRLHYVTENGPKLHISRKSSQLIKIINKKLDNY